MTDVSDPAVYSWMRPRLKRDVAELIRLAVPIILARSGIVLMITVDIIMVGHYSSQELANQSIALALIMPMIVIGLGLLMGTLVITANLFGAGQLHGCGKAWRNSLPYALCLGLMGMVSAFFGEPILLFLGQSPDLAASGGEIMKISGYGLPAFMVFLTTALFLEGVKRPVPSMVFLLVANVVNLVLNWILIYGKFGYPEMGAEGAAWATTAARWFVAMSLVAYVWTMKDRRRFAIRGGSKLGWRAWKQQRRIGYAASIGLGAETCSFAVFSIFAGWLGTLPLAAFSLTFNLITMVFMVTLGLGSATSIRVGIAHGGNNHDDLARAGWTGLGANTVAMAAFGVLFLVAARPLAELFSNDPALISVATPMIAFTAVLLVVDGGQGIMAYALRGRQDVWIPCGMQIFAFFGVMIPVVYLLVFMGDQGAIGLLRGILIGSGVSFGLLLWRFYKLARWDKLAVTVTDDSIAS